MRSCTVIAAAALFASVARAEDAPFVALVRVQLELRMDPKVRQALKPEDLRQMTLPMLKEGWKELEPGVLIDEAKPLAGRWIEIGKNRYLIGSDGLVHLPELPVNLKNLKLYNDVADAKPWQVIPMLEVVPVGTTPPVTLVKLRGRFPPGEMN